MNNKDKNIFNKFPFSLKPDLSIFEKATDEEKKQQERMRNSSSFFRDGINRFFKNPVSVISLVIIVFITLIAFIVPLIYPYKYEETSVNEIYTKGFQRPLEYSLRESIVMKDSKNVIFMGWSYSNEETYTTESYGGLDVIDSQEYLEKVKKYFVTDTITFESDTIQLFAVWGIDNDNDGVADYGGDLFTNSSTRNLSTKHSIIYHINGGSGDTPEDPTKYSYGDSVVPLNDSNLLNITKSGYVFVGWSLYEGVIINSESDYKTHKNKFITRIIFENTDINLYPIWAKDSNNDGKTDVRISLTYGSNKFARYSIVYDTNLANESAPIDSYEYSFGDTISPLRIEDVSLTKKHVNVFPHILGTDLYGRDYCIRVIVGARVSLLVGIVAAVMVVIIGVIYGAISGYFGGKVDMVMMRIVDIVYSLPDTLIIILFSVSFRDIIVNSSFANIADKIGGTAMVSILTVFAMLYWVGMARLVRGQVLTLREQEYVLAAKAMGAKPLSIIFKHMLPNCISVIFISAALQIPSAIFTESTLSFLGVGVSEPMPSLGSLASLGRAYMSIDSQRYLFIIPSIVIFLIVLSLNLLGQGLRDAFDPKIRNNGGK